MKKYLLLGLAMMSSVFGQDYKVVQKDTIRVVGIECRTSNAPDAAPNDIPKLWDRFYKEEIAGKIPNKLSDEVIALYCDYEGDWTKPYSLVIGCKVSSVSDVPKGMVAKTIPGGSYAVFNAVGEYPKNLVKTWQKIWQQASLGRTYTGDYELYGEKFVTGSPKEVDVFIAIGEPKQ